MIFADLSELQTTLSVKLQLRGDIEIGILLLLLQTFPEIHRDTRSFSAAAKLPVIMSTFIRH